MSGGNAASEILFFNAQIASLPLNFTVLMNPMKLKSMNLDANRTILMRGNDGKTAFVNAYSDPECPQGDIRIPRSVQMTLDLSIGDSVPLLAYSVDEKCEAIKIVPLFDEPDTEYQEYMKDYFSEKRPVAPDEIFQLNIHGTTKYFKILDCIPQTRCFSNATTKLYYGDLPGAVKKQASLPCHFSDLILMPSLKQIIRNSIWLPLHNQNLFQVLNLPTSNGVIVYGEQGTGKTSFLSSIARTVGYPTQYVDVKRLVNLDYKAIIEKLKKVFDFPMSKEASLIILDDIHYLAYNFSNARFCKQKRLLAQFYTLLDKAFELPGVCLVASAPSPSSVDPTLLNFGRFGYDIFLTKPNETQRCDIIKMNTRGFTLDQNSIILLSRAMNNFTQAQIEQVCINTINSLITTDAKRLTPSDPNIVFSLSQKLTLNHFRLVLQKIPGYIVPHELIEQPKVTAEPEKPKSKVPEKASDDFFSIPSHIPPDEENDPFEIQPKRHHKKRHHRHHKESFDDANNDLSMMIDSNQAQQDIGDVFTQQLGSLPSQKEYSSQAESQPSIQMMEEIPQQNTPFNQPAPQYDQRQMNPAMQQQIQPQFEQPAPSPFDQRGSRHRSQQHAPAQSPFSQQVPAPSPFNQQAPPPPPPFNQQILPQFNQQQIPPQYNQQQIPQQYDPRQMPPQYNQQQMPPQYEQQQIPPQFEQPMQYQQKSNPFGQQMAPPPQYDQQQYEQEAPPPVQRQSRHSKRKGTPFQQVDEEEDDVQEEPQEVRTHQRARRESDGDNVPQQKSYMGQMDPTANPFSRMNQTQRFNVGGGNNPFSAYANKGEQHAQEQPVAQPKRRQDPFGKQLDQSQQPQFNGQSPFQASFQPQQFPRKKPSPFQQQFE